ncbi:MAG: hypothetical protein AAFV95_27245 [Bacteroidota bacterium]
MNIKWMGFIVLMSLNASLAWGQKKVKTTSDFYREIMYVDEEGKENGLYQMRLKGRGKPLIEGQYEHGKKVGVWNFYNRLRKEYFTYDFDHSEIIYSRFVLQRKQAGKWVPLRTVQASSPQIGEYVYQMYKAFDYPEKAYEHGVEGTVIIALILDEEGRVTDWEKLRDVGAGLGTAGVELTKVMDIKWDLPGPGNYRILVPIIYMTK